MAAIVKLSQRRISPMSEVGRTEYSWFELLGREAGVQRLVERFYELMNTLPEASEVRGLHPDDLSVSTDKLYKFLCGFFGGPTLYIKEYGHPALRARHLPFKIDESARDQWLLCMFQAIDEQVSDKFLADQVKASFYRTADHMRNV